MAWWTVWIRTVACRARVRLSPSAAARLTPSTSSARTNPQAHSKPPSHSISKSASSLAQRARMSLTETTPLTEGRTVCCVCCNEQINSQIVRSVSVLNNKDAPEAQVLSGKWWTSSYIDHVNVFNPVHWVFCDVLNVIVQSSESQWSNPCRWQIIRIIGILRRLE